MIKPYGRTGLRDCPKSTGRLPDNYGSRAIDEPDPPMSAFLRRQAEDGIARRSGAAEGHVMNSCHSEWVSAHVSGRAGPEASIRCISGRD